MEPSAEVRTLISRVLSWEDADVGFDTAIAGIPPELRGQRPPGLPYSPWEILEHLRRTQRDILEFCRNPDYRELSWPEDYWPTSPVPASDAAWDESVRQFLEDRKALQQLAADPKVDLASEIPH